MSNIYDIVLIMLEFIEVKHNQTDKLAELASAIWHEYWVDILSPEQIDYMVQTFQSSIAMQNQIENECYHYFLIIQDGEIAGYTGFADKENYLFLSKLYLKKEFRHRGIGTLAFKFIKDFCKNNHYNEIRLTVNKYNKNTIAAYKKWGFKVTESVVTDIGEGFVMDDYIMSVKPV